MELLLEHILSLLCSLSQNLRVLPRSQVLPSASMEFKSFGSLAACVGWEETLLLSCVHHTHFCLWLRSPTQHRQLGW